MTGPAVGDTLAVAAPDALPHLLRQVLPPAHLLLGLLLAAWTLLFLFRIVLTWYPQVDLSKGAMRLVAIPTETVYGVGANGKTEVGRMSGPMAVISGMDTAPGRSPDRPRL